MKCISLITYYMPFESKSFPLKTDLCGLQDEVMNDDLLLTGEAESVFTDKSDCKRLTVHGFLSTRPIHKLILRLREQT